MTLSPLHPLAIEGWPKNKLAAFELLAPVSLYIASTDHAMTVALLAKDGSVARRFGGNRGVWPVKLGLSWQYQDTVTKALRGADSFQDWHLRWRRWLFDEGDAPQRLLDAAMERMGDAAREHGYADLLHSRIDAGPDFWRVHRFTEAIIMPLARDLGLQVWTDAELSEFLDRAMKRSAQIGIGRREGPFREMCMKMIAEDRANFNPLAMQYKGWSRVSEGGAPHTSFPMKRMDDEATRAVAEWERRKAS
jgi:hypothetical protein